MYKLQVYDDAFTSDEIATLASDVPAVGPVYGANNRTVLTDGKLAGKIVRVWGKVQSKDTGSYVISDGYATGVTINGTTALAVGDMAVVTGVRNADATVTP